MDENVSISISMSIKKTDSSCIYRFETESMCQAVSMLACTLSLLTIDEDLTVIANSKKFDERFIIDGIPQSMIIQAREQVLRVRLAIHDEQIKADILPNLFLSHDLI